MAAEADTHPGTPALHTAPRPHGQKREEKKKKGEKRKKERTGDLGPENTRESMMRTYGVKSLLRRCQVVGFWRVSNTRGRKCQILKTF